MRKLLPLLLIPLTVSAETDYLGRCEKAGLLPSGLNPVPGRKYARDRLVDVKHLALDVTPDFARRSVAGQVTISFSPIATALKRVELDSVGLTIESVTTDGPAVSSHEVTQDKLIIHFSAALPSGKDTSVTVRYHGTPESGLHFRTPEMGYPQGDTQCWSQGEAEFHRYWFPCYDYPNDRFTTEVVCHAPDGMEVVSNGRLVSREKDRDGMLVRWHWSQEQPHVNYLIALAVGHFQRVDGKAGNTPLAVFVPPSEKDQAALAFRDTQAILNFYERELGTPFPWAKYFTVYCHDFLAGGMENTSCTFNAASALFPAEVGELDTIHRLDAHEMAHQWFGDLLTCRDWSHLWLNEGFASYYTVLYEQEKYGHDGFMVSLWDEAQKVLNSGDTRPMVWRDYTEPMQQFDNRAYPRGAWVLHMLRCQLGPDLYRRAVTEYVRRHRNTNVTSDDLQEVMEEMSGRSFDQYFDQWVHHGGVPELGIEYAWNGDAKTVRMTVQQNQKVDEKVLLFNLPLPVRFFWRDAEGKLQSMDQTAAVTKTREDFTWTLPEKPVLVRIDPDMTVLAKIGWTPPGDMIEEQLKSDVIGGVLAVKELAKKKDDATVTRLTAVINSNAHHRVKTEAVDALRRTPSPAARTALISLTNHAEERVRKGVADALASILHPDAHAALVKMAAEEKNPIIVSSIVNSFGPWPQEDLIPFVKRSSYQNMIATAAIRTLRDQNRTDAVPAILEALKGVGFPAREKAACLNALGTLARGTKNDAVLDFLRSQLTHPHRAVASAAASALGEFGDLRAIPALNAIAGQQNNQAAPAAGEAAGRIRALQNPVEQSIEAWKKVEALQRKTEELEKKLETLEKKR